MLPHCKLCNLADFAHPDLLPVLRRVFAHELSRFGPDFPADIRKKVEDALLAFKETDGWDESIGDFYTWESIRPATDSEYDVVRDIIEGAGYSMDDIVGFMEE